MFAREETKAGLCTNGEVANPLRKKGDTNTLGCKAAGTSASWTACNLLGKPELGQNLTGTITLDLVAPQGHRCTPVPAIVPL